MKISLSVALLGCVAAVSARPVFQKRQQQLQPAINDVLILQYALSLENLEAEFYLQGLNKFSEADFRRENVPNPTQAFQNFHHILQHEAQHVKTLQTVITSLGGQPVPPCEYQFPFQTVRQFIAIANALEKVGVSAYNGALAIMQSPDLKTAAATIDTVEARHASFIQTSNGGDPFPENFDVALDGRQVTTLASPFIKQCSFDLGFVPFGQLQVKKQIQLPESDVEVAFQPQAGGQQQFCNWLFSDQSIVVPLNGNLCKIPPGARGDVYLMITCEQSPVSLKKTNTIIAGPAIVTVDTAHTDSCKEFFSGKQEKEGKLNEPIDHGPIPINNPAESGSLVSDLLPQPLDAFSSPQPSFGSPSLEPAAATQAPPGCGQAACGQPPVETSVPPSLPLEPTTAPATQAGCGQPACGQTPMPEPSFPVTTPVAAAATQSTPECEPEASTAPATQAGTTPVAETPTPTSEPAVAAPATQADSGCGHSGCGQSPMPNETPVPDTLPETAAATEAEETPMPGETSVPSSPKTAAATQGEKYYWKPAY